MRKLFAIPLGLALGAGLYASARVLCPYKLVHLDLMAGVTIVYDPMSGRTSLNIVELPFPLASSLEESTGKDHI